MDGFECIVISTNAAPKAANEEKSCKGNRKISLPMLFIGIEMTEGKSGTRNGKTTFCHSERREESCYQDALQTTAGKKALTALDICDAWHS